MAGKLNLLGMLARGPARTLLLGIVAIGLAAYGLSEAWRRFGTAATASGDYVVTPERIETTPQPDWIKADVRAEVIRDGSLGRLDLRDRGVVEKVSQAFALHSWVARVRRVQKSFPARIRVELEYRRPVAMVEVTAQGRPGLLFVDAGGVLLPSGDFSTDQSHRYLRISAGNVAPSGVYGAPWGNEKIAGAARLAAAWRERWQPLGLYRIAVVDNASAGKATYELRTKSGRRVLWGNAPGSEDRTEPRAEDKIGRLLTLTAGQPLDRLAGNQVIDLRTTVATRSLAPLQR